MNNNVQSSNNTTQNIANQSTSNPVLAQNLLDETRFFEAFSTYKIIVLELISIYCTLKVNQSLLYSCKKFYFIIFITCQKNKQKNEANKNDSKIDGILLDFQTSVNESMASKDQICINASQEIKFLNLILKAVKVKTIQYLTIFLLILLHIMSVDARS